MPLTLSGTNGVSGIDGSAGTPTERGSDADTGVFYPSAGNIAISTNGTEALRVDSSQNVGIGTTTVNNRLEVGGVLAIQRSTNSARVSTISMETGNFVITADSTYNMIFNTGGSERARIDTSGNLLVGTTSSSDTSGAGIKILPGGYAYAVSASSTGGASSWNMYSTGASAYRFYVNYAGTVFATSTTISGISDQRLKENIRDLDVGLDAILSLQPRKFDWKAGKGKDIKNDRGFIAQEFEQVFPDLIDEWKDEPPEGEEPYKSVRQDLIPVLVKAIQELSAKNDALEARIAALEAN